jgi:hypothetical protein
MVYMHISLSDINGNVLVEVSLIIRFYPDSDFIP